MNEQEKRENVIKGLERCIEKLDTMINKAHGFNCTVCPYFRKCDSSGYLIGLPLMRDALALLKAQEQDAQREYEAAVEMAEYCERYEPTYNPEDGSM